VDSGNWSLIVETPPFFDACICRAPLTNASAIGKMTEFARCTFQSDVLSGILTGWSLIFDLPKLSQLSLIGYFNPLPRLLEVVILSGAS
jgi:hypothetical protein